MLTEPNLKVLQMSEDGMKLKHCLSGYQQFGLIWSLLYAESLSTCIAVSKEIVRSRYHGIINWQLFKNNDIYSHLNATACV